MSEQNVSKQVNFEKKVQEITESTKSSQSSTGSGGVSPTRGFYVGDINDACRPISPPSTNPPVAPSQEPPSSSGSDAR